MPTIAERVAADHSVVEEDQAWFEGCLGRVEREVRMQYADRLARIAEHIEGGNLGAALSLCRENDA